MVLLVALSLGPVPVQAEPTDALDAPTGLSGEYDPETHELALTWLPPDNDTSDYVYRVYEDTVLLANTTLTQLTTNVSLGLHVYWVTATNAQGVESLPSLPLLVPRTEGSLGSGSLPAIELMSGGGAGGGCEAIIVIIDDDPPFVDAGVRKECLPPLPCAGLGALAGRGC